MLAPMASHTLMWISHTHSSWSSSRIWQSTTPPPLLTIDSHLLFKKSIICFFCNVSSCCWLFSQCGRWTCPIMIFSVEIVLKGLVMNLATELQEAMMEGYSVTMGIVSFCWFILKLGTTPRGSETIPITFSTMLFALLISSPPLDKVYSSRANLCS